MKKLKKIITALLTASVVLTSLCGCGSGAQDLYTKAYKLAEQGNYEKAMKTAEKIDHTAPSYCLAVVQVYYKQGMYDEAARFAMSWYSDQSDYYNSSEYSGDANEYSLFYENYEDMLMRLQGYLSNNVSEEVKQEIDGYIHTVEPELQQKEFEGISMDAFEE